MEASVDRGTASLTSIEKVMLLQSVELFRYCSAEEILRIAAIAQLRTFGEGEEIFHSSEPAEFLYCVVEGRVGLDVADGQPAELGPGRAFGVIEILSGRLRQRSARALEPTTTLAMEGEDFYDLLSNNIEIVRALFRMVLNDRSEEILDLR